MVDKRKNSRRQKLLESSSENDETIVFDIQPALHFNVKEYRARLKHEKEVRKKLREAKKHPNQ